MSKTFASFKITDRIATGTDSISPSVPRIISRHWEAMKFGGDFLPLLQFNIPADGMLQNQQGIHDIHRTITIDISIVRVDLHIPANSVLQR